MIKSYAASRIWYIMGLGMALRVIWVLFVPVEPVSDSAAYAAYARTLAEHGSRV